MALRYSFKLEYKTRFPFKLKGLKGNFRGACIKITNPKDFSEKGENGHILYSIDGTVVTGIVFEHIEEIIKSAKRAHKKDKGPIVFEFVNNIETALHGDHEGSAAKKKRRRKKRSKSRKLSKRSGSESAGSETSSGADATSNGGESYQSSRADEKTNGGESDHGEVEPQSSIVPIYLLYTWPRIPFELKPVPNKKRGVCLSRITEEHKPGMNKLQVGDILATIDSEVVVKKTILDVQLFLSKCRSKQQETRDPIVLKFVKQDAAQRHKDKVEELRRVAKAKAAAGAAKKAKEEEAMRLKEEKRLREIVGEQRKREEEKQRKLEEKEKARLKAIEDEKLKLHLIEVKVEAEFSSLPFQLVEIEDRAHGMCVQTIVDASKCGDRLTPKDILCSVNGKKCLKLPEFSIMALIKKFAKGQSVTGKPMTFQFIDHVEAEYRKQHRLRKRKEKEEHLKREKERSKAKERGAGPKKGIDRTKRAAAGGQIKNINQKEVSIRIKNMSHNELLQDITALHGKDRKAVASERMKKLQRDNHQKVLDKDAAKANAALAEQQKNEVETKRLEEAKKRKEIAMAYIQKQKQRERLQEEKERLRHLFELIDADGSGHISKVEFLHTIESDPKIHDFVAESPWLHGLVISKQLENVFAKLDTGQDGQISFEEFWLFCEKMQRGTKNDRKKIGAQPPKKAHKKKSNKQQPTALLLSERKLGENTFLCSFGNGNVGLQFFVFHNVALHMKHFLVMHIEKNYHCDHLKVGDVLVKINSHACDVLDLPGAEDLIESEPRPTKLKFEHGSPEFEAAAQSKYFEILKDKRKRQREEQSRVKISIQGREKRKKKEKMKLKKQKQKIGALFQKYNKDNDGHLTRDEMALLCKKMQVYVPDDHVPETAECRKLIRMMGDMDNSGTIDEKEFTEWVTQHLDMSKQELKEISNESVFMKKICALLKAFGMWLAGEKPPPNKEEQAKLEKKRKKKLEKKKQKEVTEKAEKLKKLKAKQRKKRKLEKMEVNKSQEEKDEEKKALMASAGPKKHKTPLGMNYSSKKKKKPGHTALQDFDKNAGREREYQVSFRTKTMGLVLDEEVSDQKKDNRLVRIMSVSYACAKKHPGIFSIGDFITHVAQINVEGKGYFEVMDLIKQLPRPISIVFKHVDAEDSIRVKERFDTINATLIIQKLVRGRQARKAVQQITDSFPKPSDRNNASATVIQSAVRVWIALRKVPNLMQLFAKEKRLKELEQRNEKVWMEEMLDELAMAGFTDGASFLWEEVLAELEEIEVKFLRDGESQEDDETNEPHDDTTIPAIPAAIALSEEDQPDHQIPMGQIWASYVEEDFIPNAAPKQSFVYTPPTQFGWGTNSRGNKLMYTPNVHRDPLVVKPIHIENVLHPRISFSSPHKQFVPQPLVPTLQQHMNEQTFESHINRQRATKDYANKSERIVSYFGGNAVSSQRPSLSLNGGQTYVPPYIVQINDRLNHGKGRSTNQTSPPKGPPVQKVLFQAGGYIHQAPPFTEYHESLPMASGNSSLDPTQSRNIIFRAAGTHGFSPPQYEKKRQGRVLFRANEAAKPTPPPMPPRASVQLTGPSPRKVSIQARRSSDLLKDRLSIHDAGSKREPGSSGFRISKLPRQETGTLRAEKAIHRGAAVKERKWEAKYYKSIRLHGKPDPKLYVPKQFTDAQKKRANKAKMAYLKRVRQQKTEREQDAALIWEGDSGTNSIQLIGSHQVSLLGKYYYHNPRETLRKTQARKKRRNQKVADQERSRK
jgi:Ca2+-binding EF-hand superfamily protein